MGGGLWGLGNTAERRSNVRLLGTHLFISSGFADDTEIPIS